MSDSIEHISGHILPYALDALQGVPGHADFERRFGFGAIGNTALLLAAGLVTDDVIGRWRSGGSEPHITHFPAQKGASDKVLTVFGGGFNSCATGAANVYSQVATGYGHMIAVTDPKSGYDRESNNKKVSALCDELQPEVVVLHGDSMRMLKHIQLARHLKEERGLQVRLLAVCSPRGIWNVKDPKRHRMLNVLDTIYGLGIRGGPKTRSLVEITGYMIDHIGDKKGVKDAIRHVRRKQRKPDMPTNPQVLKDARLLKRYDATEDLQAIRDIPMAHISPDDPARDVVVDNPQAVADYRASLDTVVPIHSPRIGHANPCDEPSAYKRAVRTAYRMLDV